VHKKLKHGILQGIRIFEMREELKNSFVESSNETVKLR